MYHLLALSNSQNLKALVISDSVQLCKKKKPAMEVAVKIL
jgi:hypothetical protein